MFKRIIVSILLILSPYSYAYSDNAKNVFLAWLAKPHSYNITGDGSVYIVKFDRAIYANGISYDDATARFTLSESGTYLATWSLPIDSMNQYNTTATAWIRAGGHEHFIYNGNPYSTRNIGGVPGGGIDIIAIVGSHIFKADVSVDPYVWLAIKVNGNSTKNITLLYDAFFSLKKIG